MRVTFFYFLVPLYGAADDINDQSKSKSAFRNKITNLKLIITQKTITKSNFHH
jgi:hypothetical protein